ncbi:MAG: hypothetical protein ACYC3I_00895 [Gemmataceae bacterium]
MDEHRPLAVLISGSLYVVCDFSAENPAFPTNDFLGTQWVSAPRGVVVE